MALKLWPNLLDHYNLSQNLALESFGEEAQRVEYTLVSENRDLFQEAYIRYMERDNTLPHETLVIKALKSVPSIRALRGNFSIADANAFLLEEVTTIRGETFEAPSFIDVTLNKRPPE